MEAWIPGRRGALSLYTVASMNRLEAQLSPLLLRAESPILPQRTVRLPSLPSIALRKRSV